MTIRLGIVGLSSKGWASMMLAPPLLQPPLDSLYSLAAVSTTNADSAAASAKKWSELAGRPVKPYHGSTSAIAADPELDLIVVAVNAPQHKAAVMPIIEAGKDIFIEWPVGKNLQETVEIAEAAKKKGIRSLVGTQCRQTSTIRKVSWCTYLEMQWLPMTLVSGQIKSIIESGQIGRVLSSTFVSLPCSPEATHADIDI